MINKFDLGSVEWSVSIDNERMDDTQAFGLCVSERCHIYLQERNRSADAVEQTLYHEVVHAILDTMGMYDLSRDEAFVQGFSVLLHQFENTKK